MSVDAYLLLVLHGHLPFVRSCERQYGSEDNWLNEAVTECYIPLIEMFEGLQRDGIQARVTLNVTPCLVEMLNDHQLRDHYDSYLDERIEFLARDKIQRGIRGPEALAHYFRDRFLHCQEVYHRWGRDLVSAFRCLQDTRLVTILGSAATHAYLPLWEIHPELVELQVSLGLDVYRRNFRRQPFGFWLPECGFSRGLDHVLQRHDIKYSFLENLAILNADHRPKFREYAPIHTPAGVAIFGRDLHTRDLVWHGDNRYAEDACYLNFNGDIGQVWDCGFVSELTRINGPVHTGIRYYRNGGNQQLYNPDEASSRCRQHAEHFVRDCIKWAKSQRDDLDRPPVIVAMFDMEHFGHWWHEGPDWLNLMIREAEQHEQIKLITAEDYLDMYATNQVINPSETSWGEHGYSGTWLMERNDWIYPELYQAADVLQSLIGRADASGTNWHPALNQYLRELLVAQSSDWAFLMRWQTCEQYAIDKVKTHCEKMEGIRVFLEGGGAEQQWISSLIRQNNIFADVDLCGLHSRCCNISG